MARRFVDRLVGPCPVRAAERAEVMTPDALGARCGRCEKQVVDLSRLTRRQAKPFLERSGCVRVQLGPDGEPLFAPDRDRGARGLLLAGALAVAGCSGAPHESAPVALASAPMRAADLPIGVALEEIDPGVVAAWESPEAPDRAPKHVAPVPAQVAAQPVPPYYLYEGLIEPDF